LVRRATPHNTIFVCETLPPEYAVEIVKDYLIDAALSLTEGRGTLIVPNAHSV